MAVRMARACDFVNEELGERGDLNWARHHFVEDQWFERYLHYIPDGLSVRFVWWGIVIEMKRNRAHHTKIIRHECPLEI